MISIRHPSDNQHYEKIGKEVKCIEDEIPFEIPESWAWCRLGTCGNFVRGSGIKRNETSSEGIQCVRYGEIYTAYNTSFSRAVSHVPCFLADKCKSVSYGDALLTLTGENKQDIAKTIVYLGSERLVIGGDLALFTHHCFDPMFLAFLLNSPYVNYQKSVAASGDIIVHISAVKLSGILIAVPPLYEQKHIVSAMEEAIPKINKYGKYQSSLEALDQGINAKLKKSILQYAIQGKLVPQDPSDESASVLLERIRAEKEQMIKDGKIKRDKNESYIYRGSDNSYYISLHGVDKCIDDEIPFEIPASWCWVTLSSICTYIQRGKSPKYSDIKKIPVVAQKCNQWSGFDISKAKFIEPESLKKYEPERYLCTGDLLWNSTGLGTVGRMAIYDESKNPYSIAVADSHVSVIRTKENFARFRYLFYWFTSPTVQSVIESKTEGSTKQKELYLQKIKDYIVPLPPINEQDRIVNEIDGYMSFDF